jgi:CBS domain-containing protein
LIKPFLVLPCFAALQQRFTWSERLRRFRTGSNITPIPKNRAEFASFRKAILAMGPGKTGRSSSMQIKHILGEKGGDVIGIGLLASLADAAALLAERRIGAVVVRDVKGDLVGILSERDLVRALATDGAAALEHKVSRYLTRDVVTCRLSDTIEDLMEMMTRGRFRHVPVLDDAERLCGLISIGDVVKSRIAETVREAEDLRVYISATG